MYKSFTKILANCLTAKLDYYQAAKQPVFKKGCGTVDFYTVRMLIEKCEECNANLPVAFIYIHIQCTWHIWNISFLESLGHARTVSRYTHIIKNIYDNATLLTKIDNTTNTNQNQLKRGTRQEDTTLHPPNRSDLPLKTFLKHKVVKKGINISRSYRELMF